MLVGLIKVLAWFASKLLLYPRARFAGRVPTSNVTSGAIAQKNESDQVSGLARATGHASGPTARPQVGTASQICGDTECAGTPDARVQCADD